MTLIRKSTLAALAGLGVLTLLAAPSFAAADPLRLAHMAQGQGGQGMMGQGMAGQGTMGQGMAGQGMMAPGMNQQGAMGSCSGGPGMMGPGMMGQGMMGMMGRHMRGQAMMGMMGRHVAGQAMMGQGDRVVPMAHLSTDDVRHFLEHRLQMRGNKRLKVGAVTAAGEDKIVADITTVDDSLVQRLEVDRHSGMISHVE